MTLIAQNNSGAPPSQSDLQSWANSYGLTHPVLSDPNFDIVVRFLWANSGFDGTIGLPNVQLMSPGMVVHSTNQYGYYQSEIASLLP